MARNRTLEYLEQAQRQLPGGMPARTVPGYGGQINYGALPPRQPYGGLDLPPELFGPMKPPATQPMPQMQPATQPAQPAPQMQPAYPMPPAFDMAASRERAMQAGRDLRANVVNWGGSGTMDRDSGGVMPYQMADILKEARQLGGAADMARARQKFTGYRGGAARRADETPEQFQARAQAEQAANAKFLGGYADPLSAVDAMMNQRRELIAAGYDPRVPASAQQMRDTGQAALTTADANRREAEAKYLLNKAQAGRIDTLAPAERAMLEATISEIKAKIARGEQLTPSEKALNEARVELYKAQTAATQAGTQRVEAGDLAPPEFTFRPPQRPNTASMSGRAKALLDIAKQKQSELKNLNDQLATVLAVNNQQENPASEELRARIKALSTEIDGLQKQAQAAWLQDEQSGVGEYGAGSATQPGPTVITSAMPQGSGSADPETMLADRVAAYMRQGMTPDQATEKVRTEMEQQ